MATTSLGIPIPALSDQPNGPGQMQAAFDKIDALEVEVRADTSWVNCPHGASYASGTGSYVAQLRLRGIQVTARGRFYMASGNNFAPNSAIILIAAGSISAQYRPTAPVEVTLAGHSAGSAVRAVLGADGTLTIGTGDEGPAYVSLAGLSGYLTT